MGIKISLVSYLILTHQTHQRVTNGNTALIGRLEIFGDFGEFGGLLYKKSPKERSKIMEGNKTAEKIEALKKKLEELHNQQLSEPTDVDMLLEYWDKEDTIVAEIKELSFALSMGIDIVAANSRTPADNIQYIIGTFGVEEERKI